MKKTQDPVAMVVVKSMHVYGVSIMFLVWPRYHESYIPHFTYICLFTPAPSPSTADPCRPKTTKLLPLLPLHITLPHFILIINCILPHILESIQINRSVIISMWDSIIMPALQWMAQLRESQHLLKIATCIINYTLLTTAGHNVHHFFRSRPSHWYIQNIKILRPKIWPNWHQFDVQRMWVGSMPLQD